MKWIPVQRRMRGRNAGTWDRLGPTEEEEASCKVNAQGCLLRAWL